MGPAEVVFLDTSAIYARKDEADKYHATAVRGFERLLEQGAHTLTTDLVVSESLALMANRKNYAFAAQVAQGLMSSTVEILTPNTADRAEALRLFMGHIRDSWSWTDCVSFALMRRHGVHRAFAFDTDFQEAGFDLWPEART